MAATNATNARQNLFRLITQVNESHEPVLVSEDDWRAIEETLHLNSIPGMETPISEDPFRSPPPYQRFVGNVSGAISRRINIQHRLVYQAVHAESVVKILRMWAHFE